MQGKKICNVCKKEKQLNDFYRCGISSDFHKSWCKECHNRRAKERKQKRKLENLITHF